MNAMADPQRSGVYRSPSDIGRVRASADSGIRWIDVSLRDVNDKSELMRAFAQALRFPSTFGSNWDALADSLQDSACPGGKGCVLHIADSGMSGVPEADRAKLIEVLSASAAYWSAHGKAFVVLVDGATQLTLWT
jgi:hypothetical protein